MTDLAKRLADGPSSRALSDEVLLALGWHRQEDKRLDPDLWLWVAPGSPPILYLTPDRPNVTEVTDDALALVPEGLNANLNRFHRSASAFLHDGEVVIGPGTMNEATGENPLPRAICIAVLRTK